MTSHELVLSGGRVLNSASGLDTTTDIAISDGRIAAIGPNLSRDSRTTLDCSNSYVTPGLIDSHSHVFAHVSKVGAPVDEAHLSRGVVAVSDAGSVGASTFEAFLRYVVKPAKSRVLSFLNVSALGLIDFRFGELLNPETLVPQDAIDIARDNPDIVKGLKIRLSTDVVGQNCLPLLEIAVATGEDANLPVMVHIGETAATLGEILALLRPNDVVAHCYTGKENGILEGGHVTDEVWAARERGVLFECAHGKSNFSYAVAKPAIEQGFLPDLVCSDTSYRNWNGPVFDLLTTMSKLAALGMDFPDIVARATVAPAHFLGLWAEGYGRLEVGGQAYVTVFSQLAEPEEVPDAAGGSLSLRRFEPSFVVLRDETIQSVPWRGTNPSAS